MRNLTGALRALSFDQAEEVLRVKQKEPKKSMHQIAVDLGYIDDLALQELGSAIPTEPSDTS